MMARTILVLFISVVLNFQHAFSQPSAGIPSYDELLMGSKAVSMCDSMANSRFFYSTVFEEDMSPRYHYTHPASYVPEYNDSLLKVRIAEMNAASPIEFRFNVDVKAHIDFYLKRRSFIARLIGLSDLYFPMFEEMLDKYGLPLELKFLPIVESALNPIAKSRAGAAGLWQFMYKTGLMYGLNNNSYVDDRFDPYKATDAACRHFIDLYKIYGDWALCLAAYNAGAGRINRAIKATNNQFDYWKIRVNLPRETQKYVPAYIAAAYVFTYYAEHNIRPMVPVIIDTKVDTVAAKAELSFLVISNMLDIPIEQVELLNPAYKKQLIPAPVNGAPYYLRIPKNKSLKFTELETDLYYMTYATKYPDLMSEFVTPSGLTVYKGAYRTGSSLALNESDSLKLLKTIGSPEELLNIIITRDPIETASTANSSGTSSNTTSSSSKTPTGTHIVQTGESLGIIAQKYGCSVDQIVQWNNLSSRTIHPGQKLKVSGTASSTSTNATNANKSTGNVTWYTVKSGDSLWGIANKHSTTVEKIKADNNLSGNNLQIGQKLKIIK
jgi:membrane-bound lytic murein transglycosylase D